MYLVNNYWTFLLYLRFRIYRTAIISRCFKYSAFHISFLLYISINKSFKSHHCDPIKAPVIKSRINLLIFDSFKDY